MLYTQVGALCCVLDKLTSDHGLCTVCLTAGNVPLPAVERGFANPRQAHPGTFLAIHEVVAVSIVPVAAGSRAHLPRREA